MIEVLNTMDILYEQGYIEKEDLSEVEEEIEKVMRVPMTFYRAAEVVEQPECIFCIDLCTCDGYCCH